MKRASRIFLHTLFIVVILAMLGPQAWKLATNDDDPRVRIAGWFLVIHKDNEMVIRTPGSTTIGFSYWSVYLVCWLYIIFGITWIVLQKNVATSFPAPVDSQNGRQLKGTEGDGVFEGEGKE
jgi:hypothetical protein